MPSRRPATAVSTATIRRTDSPIRAGRIRGGIGATVFGIAAFLVLFVPPGGAQIPGPGAPVVAAAPGWHNVTFGQLGPMTQDGAMAYDILDHEMVDFIGITPNVTGRVNYTWTFDARTWHNVTSSVAPSRRAWPAMAYDPLLGAVLLFGGFDNGPSGGNALGDTWEFKGGNWTLLHPTHSPAARGGAAMVYDAALGRMVLFGGSPSFTSFSSSSGTVWSFGKNGSRVPGPSGNLSGSLTWAGIAYDAHLAEVVVFGGMPFAGCGCETNTTWVLSGSNWSRVVAPSALNARLWVQMAYDPALNATVMFGGTYARSGYGFSGYNDTWTFSAHGWSPLTVAGPLQRAYGYLVWNPPMRGMFLYGGIVPTGPGGWYAQGLWVFR